MLQTLEEIKRADFPESKVINGVDNANVLSISSIEPIQTEVDKIEAEDETDESGTVVDKKESVEKQESKKEKPTEEESVKESKKEVEKEPKKDLEKNEKSESKEVEKRIGSLTRKWRTAERERDFERNKRLELEKEIKTLKSTVSVGEKPNRANFEDEDAFLEALTDWKVETKLNAKITDSAKEVEEEKEKQTAAEVQNSVDEVLNKGREKYDDYDTVVCDKELSLNQNMVETILDSAIAEELFYFLGKNPDVSADIAKLKPLTAAKELGRIEDRLLAGIPKLSVSTEGKEDPDKKEERRELPIKKLTKTPEPITPVESTGAIDKDPSKMTMAEYRAWRMKHK